MRTTKLLIVPLLLLAGGLFSTGCASDRQVIAQASQMQTQLETAKDLDQQGYGPKSHKAEDTSWMFGNDMKFHFVNSKTVNAFTTGGNHMYVYNALFQMCKDEDELAAVMAHEYGHVYARHVAKGMNRQYAALAAAAALGAGGYVAG